MNAAPSITVSYRSSEGHPRELEIPSEGLVILAPGEENRRLFRALVGEAERRRELDSPSYSLITPSHVITSALPPTTTISLHGFSRSSQPLHELLSLTESLCSIARQSEAVCPTCGIKAAEVSLQQFFPTVLDLFQDTSVMITQVCTEPPDQIRARFPEIIRNDVLLDTLDLSDEELGGDGPIVGVVYRGRISPEREATVRDALHVFADCPEPAIQIRGTEPPFSVLRHLGRRPTCPHCGQSTYPLTPSYLSSMVERFRRNGEGSPLLWYPLLRDLLFHPPADVADQARFLVPAISETLAVLADFGITASLATPTSELSLRERLCLRFLPVVPIPEGLLLIELPSYGLSEKQAHALKRWFADQKDRCGGMVALGGDNLIGEVAEVIHDEIGKYSVSGRPLPEQSSGNPSSFGIDGESSEQISDLFGLIDSEPPTLWSITSYQANLLADALLQSTDPDSSWKIVDLASLILDRNGSSQPLLTTLPVFRRLTALYAQVTAARVLGITARALRLSGPHSERCEECAGRGKIIEESHAITCVRCSGSRFKPNIEQLTFRGLPFPALFAHTAEALIPLFSSILPIARELTLIKQMGLGQVLLGTPEDDLPLDIRLRAELLTACANSPKGKGLLIRGLTGILSQGELSSILACLGSLATDRALRIIHDAAPR